MIAALFRRIIYPLIVFRPTYLVGMVLVRLSRKIKKATYKKDEELVTISNFMGSIRMRVDKNSYMGGSIYWCGFHHISELLFLKSFLKKDMVFVDVGANQGEFALFACSRVTEGKVIAFEPTAYQLGLLKTNVQLNNFKNIDVCDYGLFDKNDKLDIYTSENVTLHSGRHEGLSSLYKSDERQKSEGQIELRVFDAEYGEKLQRLDIIKIDVEGAELSVLKGMRKSLDKFKPHLIIEMNKETFEEAGYAIEDVLSFLDELGYQPNKLFRGRISPMVNRDFSDYSNTVFVASN